MPRYHYITNFEEDVKSYGYIRQYLRVYDEKDIILFSSYNKDEFKILSNFHQSSKPLPWMGKQFNSAEAMLFYSYFSYFINDPKLEKEKQSALQFIIESGYGKEVKNNELVQKLYGGMKKKVIKELGNEGWDLTDWEIACKIIKVKYEYCPEFRELVNANKDKFFCENCFWENIPKPGVLKVTDKNSPYFGKYVGCNISGLAIQRCLTL